MTAEYGTRSTRTEGLTRIRTLTVLQQHQANYTQGAHVLRFSHVHSKNRDSASGSDYSGKLLALGYVNNLSKRSSIYATASRVQNSAKGKFLIPGGSAVLAGQSSTGTELGIYHSF